MKKLTNLQWITQYARKYWVKATLALIFVFLETALMMVYPLLTGRMVDQVIEQHKLALLLPYLAWMIGTTFVRTILRYTYQLVFERIGQDTLYDLRIDLYRKLQELDFDYFNHTRVGDIMARMTGDTDAIRHFVSWVVYNILTCVLCFVVSLGIMATISWPLTLALLVVTPFIFWLTMKMSKEAEPLFFQIRESFARLNSMVEENISGNRVVKAFAQEAYEEEKFLKHNEDYKECNMASAKLSSHYLPWLDGLAGSLSLIVLLVGGLLVIKGRLTLGDLVTFNGFLWMLNQPLRMSGWLVNDVQRFQAACVKIRQLLQTKSPIRSHALTEETLVGKVVFDHVSFEFPDDPTMTVLKDIHFTALPGQTVGILGATGAGKTTLVNLIARFYDPTSGEVCIDDRTLKEYSLPTLRRSIAMVMQDVFLFSDTIEENIAFANPQMDQAYIRQMAEIADADHFISSLPEGYDTIIGERGVGLSGGQKQRLSLARALAKDPTILILDDTTSAVDMETEFRIQEQLAERTKQKTTFIIAHRISSVKDADLILVMDQGRIVEQGTHEALVALKGHYFDIYQKQLGIFTGEGGAENGA